MTESEGRKMNVRELNKAMKATLESAGIPFHEVCVCGSSVSVYCLGQETAKKWAFVLGKIVQSVNIQDTLIYNKDQSGSVNMPRTQKAIMVWGRI